MLFNYIPGFAKYLELHKIITAHVDKDMSKSLLEDIISVLLDCCRILLLEFDDMQSNVY